MPKPSLPCQLIQTSLHSLDNPNYPDYRLPKTVPFAAGAYSEKRRSNDTGASFNAKYNAAAHLRRVHFPSQLGPSLPAAVLHLNQASEDSYTEAGHFAQLWALKFGDADLPPVDNDTRAIIYWAYETLVGVRVFVTRHRILRDISFPIILSPQDWWEPIKVLCQHEQAAQTQPEHQISNMAHGYTGSDNWQAERDAAYCRAVSECPTESTYAGSSPFWDQDASTPASSVCGDIARSCCGSHPRGLDSNWFQHLYHLDRNRQDGQPLNLGFELVDVDPKERELQRKANGDGPFYWNWSSKDQNWFHENDDGTVIPFPRLV